MLFNLVLRALLKREHTPRNIVIGLLTLLFLQLVYVPSHAQSSATAQPGLDIKSLFESSSSSLKSELLDDGKFAVDNIINPDFYKIGPGDILSLMILPIPAAEQPIAVTPENTVMIPRLGVVSVKGKTLTQARDTIISILKQRNPNATVSLSLRKARLVYVTVNGDVRYPGVFAFPASTRVSTVVRMAQQRSPGGNINDPVNKTENFANKEHNRLLERANGLGLNPYSTRNIRVFHNDGTADRVDFERARFNAEGNDDPTVREGDEIYVPIAPSSYPTISISGAVRRPIVLAYREGDKASFLLKAGMGLNENADPSGVEGIGQNSTKQTFSLNTKGELSNDVDINPGYTIVVGEKQKSITSNSLGVIEIIGEVQKPGTYPITVNQTRLKDIVEKAGGFGSEAYLPLAYILQRDQEYHETRKEEGRNYLRHSDLGTEDTARFLMHNERKLPITSCDFSRCFSDKNPSETDNVFLHDGDIIVIPKNPKRVFVYGQVKNPGYIPYTPGKNAEWYVQAAGGFSAGAQESMMRIIKGRTKVWIEPEDEIMLESGDALYVPPPSQNPPGYTVQFFATVATLATSAIFLFTSLLNFFNK